MQAGDGGEEGVVGVVEAAGGAGAEGGEVGEGEEEGAVRKRMVSISGKGDRRWGCEMRGWETGGRRTHLRLSSWRVFSRLQPI